MNRKVPGHVIRLGVLAVLAIIFLFFVRQRYVPESFGELGHYRAEAIAVNADRPVRYAGMEACADCHDEIVELKQASYHRGLTCEGCHGPANDHIDDPEETRPVIPRDRRACLYCHDYRSSRPTGFPQVIESVHHTMEACMSCHDPHDPVPPETPEFCSACHGEIARTKSVSHHWTLDCETCHETPSEHRVSPRMNPANKPRSRAFCGQCHGEDATSAASIPRVDEAEHGGRYLCWQCHYPHFPEGM
jgi:hypothetical protein